MADIYQQWGSDILLSSTGDILLAEGAEEGRLRVLRRLLTNQLDYIWHPPYGAGLPAQIGETTSSAEIEAIVRRQMFYEPAVARDPPPTVKVTTIFGGMTVQIAYTDAQTTQAVGLGFTLER